MAGEVHVNLVQDVACSDGAVKTAYELKRIDANSIGANEWMAGNASPILSGGGSVDAMTGGLVSTATDYARFCLMLLRNGELDGVRLLQPETVSLLTTNQLPRATGRDDVWCYGSPGTGFSLLGSVSVEHPELDSALRPKEYGWGGMAGTAWTNDPTENFFLLSFSLVAFDLTTEEELRAGVRAAIDRFDQRKQNATHRRKEQAEREQRRMKRIEQLAAAERLIPGKKMRPSISPCKQHTICRRLRKSIMKSSSSPAGRQQLTPSKSRTPRESSRRSLAHSAEKLKATALPSLELSNVSPAIRKHSTDADTIPQDMGTAGKELPKFSAATAAEEVSS